MKLLVQIGNVGDSVVDHLMSPIANSAEVEKIQIVAHHPGPSVPKTEYYTPPRIVARSPLLAIIFEFLILLRLSSIERPRFIIGYMTFPHALLAFLAAKLTGREFIVSMIAGPAELYSIGSSVRRDFDKPVPLIGRLLLKVLEESSAIVTTGSYTSNFLIKNGIRSQRIFPIIHMPEASRYGPMATPKRYDIIFVGRLTRVKHVETLVRAIPKVKEKVGDVKVCILGEGPCKSAASSLATDLKIIGNFDFAGFQKDVASYYNASRVFVLTSEREGFPNVLLEAMMCGLPSVISNCGDVVDIAVDGLNCIMVKDYRDSAGFAMAITNLLQDKSLYARLSQNALKSVRDHSIERATREWEEILNGNNH